MQTRLDVDVLVDLVTSSSIGRNCRITTLARLDSSSGKSNQFAGPDSAAGIVESDFHQFPASRAFESENLMLNDFRHFNSACQDWDFDVL